MTIDWFQKVAQFDLGFKDSPAYAPSISQAQPSGATIGERMRIGGRRLGRLARPVVRAAAPILGGVAAGVGGTLGAQALGNDKGTGEWHQNPQTLMNLAAGAAGGAGVIGAGSLLAYLLSRGKDEDQGEPKYAEDARHATTAEFAEAAGQAKASPNTAGMADTGAEYWTPATIGAGGIGTGIGGTLFAASPLGRRVMKATARGARSVARGAGKLAPAAGLGLAGSGATLAAQRLLGENKPPDTTSPSWQEELLNSPEAMAGIGGLGTLGAYGLYRLLANRDDDEE